MSVFKKKKCNNFLLSICSIVDYFKRKKWSSTSFVWTYFVRNALECCLPPEPLSVSATFLARISNWGSWIAILPCIITSTSCNSNTCPKSITVTIRSCRRTIGRTWKSSRNKARCRRTLIIRTWATFISWTRSLLRIKIHRLRRMVRRICEFFKKIILVSMVDFKVYSSVYLGNVVTSSKTELRKSQSGKRTKRKPRVLFSQVSFLVWFLLISDIF